MKKLVVIILFFVLAGLISFYFDSEIVKFVSEFRNSFLDDFFLGITFASSEIIIFFFLTSLFLFRDKKRRLILPLWLTLLLSALVGFLLKYFVARQRPFQLGIVSVLSVLEKASHVLWNFSFPSVQSMIVFCAIPILSKGFPKLKYFWAAFAFLVGFSRVYFGVHFLSDVIFGGIIGYLIGMFVLNLEQKYKFGEKGYKKILKK